MSNPPYVNFEKFEGFVKAGLPWPARQNFEDVKYDSETRTFKGTLNFSADYKWKVTMAFSYDFIAIEKGYMIVEDGMFEKEENMPYFLRAN